LTSTSSAPSLITYLGATANLPPLGVLIWSNFIEAVVQTVREAERRLQTPSVWTFYAAKVGWWRRTLQKNANGAQVSIPEENSITEALSAILEDLRNEAGPNHPLYEQNIVFTPQQPRRRQGRIGPRSLTTDIRAHVPGNRELDLRIEAKILFKKGDLRSEFCSERGIRRFADAENPYTDGPIGAILGYAVSRTIGAWETDLETSLAHVNEVRRTSRVEIDAIPTLTSEIEVGAAERIVIVFNLLMKFQTSPVSP
jgi:hypothetical protein